METDHLPLMLRLGQYPESVFCGIHSIVPWRLKKGPKCPTWSHARWQMLWADAGNPVGRKRVTLQSGEQLRLAFLSSHGMQCFMQNTNPSMQCQKALDWNLLLTSQVELFWVQHHSVLGFVSACRLICLISHSLGWGMGIRQMPITEDQRMTPEAAKWLSASCFGCPNTGMDFGWEKWHGT